MFNTYCNKYGIVLNHNCKEKRLLDLTVLKNQFTLVFFITIIEFYDMM